MIFGKIKSLLAVLALALLLAPDAQAAPAKLSSAWMGEHETFVAWYAKQQGWDKEAGLDLTMMPFDSATISCTSRGKPSAPLPQASHP